MDSEDFLEFIENDEKLPWIQFINNLYERINIYRTLIIVKNKDCINEVCKILNEDNYSVYTPTNLNILLDFKSYLDSLKRIYLITYDYFIENKDFILMHIIPESNLFITYNLSEVNEDECNEYFAYSKKYGFMNKSIKNYIWNYYK